jgi:ABC-2 type transport system ATP-binding protein
MISIQQVTKSYGKMLALQKINTTIYPGHITGLIGPNGAGKTTLLRIISGLSLPDEGTVVVGKMDVPANPIEIKRHLGIVETDLYLYPKLTLEDHLLFVKSLHRISRRSYEERKAEIYHNLNLGEEAFIPTEELSYGNKKKCMLATALIHDPNVLILDEPLNGIDPITAKMIKDYLLRLATERNKVVLISSHALESIGKICDRVIIIKNGQLIDDLDAKRMREDNVDLEEYFVRKVQG